jgi:hypothetical protein
MKSSAPDIERYVRFVPFLGPPVANLLCGFRARTVVQGLETELRRRHRADLDVWSDVTEEALFAQSICELAMLEMSWPNDHFYPDDPAIVVFWNHRDSLDFATTIKDIEVNFEIELSDQEIERWQSQSLGEVIKDIWNNQRATDGKTVPWPPAPRLTFDP